MIRTTALLTIAVLTGCSTPDVVMKAQEPIVVDRYVFVRIDPQLTQPEPIAEGKPSEVFQVSAARKAALKRANAKLQAIEKIEGTEHE